MVDFVWNLHDSDCTIGENPNFPTLPGGLQVRRTSMVIENLTMIGEEGEFVWTFCRVFFCAAAERFQMHSRGWSQLIRDCVRVCVCIR